MSRAKRRRKRRAAWKRKRRSQRQSRQLLAELQQMKHKRDEATSVRELLEGIMPPGMRETLPELPAMLAGALAGDPSHLAQAAHMTMQRQVSLARLERMALDAGAKMPGDEDG